MFVYDLLRKANHRLKAAKKARAGRFISPVRRIERVYPVKGQRVCAMTFDDGPARTPSEPDLGGGKPLTLLLSGILTEYGAGATFDVVGDTSENYPDRRGEPDKFYWGGERYDHYPDFERDADGGAKNCPELIRALLDAGFEISNHGYRHVLFGKSPVYAKRKPFDGLDSVVEDLTRLHRLMEEQHGYTIRLARPPHYIDGIAGGFTSYDAYDLMGYHYMAASFDGGGWKPENGSFENDVKGMVEPMRQALERDPAFFSGQIIFQKDGCNMSRKTPVAAALPRQLELLKSFGYRVVSVSELMALSPFEDLSPEDECFEAARLLEAKRVPIGYRTNELRPDGIMTFGELCMALCPGEVRLARIREKNGPYGTALKWAAEHGVTGGGNVPVKGGDFSRLLEAAELPSSVPDKASFTRREALILLSEAMK